MDKKLHNLIKKLKKDKEYSIYLRGGPFILWYMKKLKMIYDKKSVEEKLNYFWIWIKVVDLEIEEGKGKGNEYLAVLLGRKSNKGTLGFKITKILQKHIKTKSGQNVFKNLFKSVIKEKKSINIKELIKNREKTSYFLAEAIKELIKKDMKENKKFNKFLHESMKMNFLIDSYVDLDDDYKKGELKFKPTIKDKNMLRLKLLKYSFSYFHVRIY